MNEDKKCAHPACKCQAPADGQFGKYCSAHCQNAGDAASVKCGCGHPGCS